VRSPQPGSEVLPIEALLLQHVRYGRHIDVASGSAAADARHPQFRTSRFAASGRNRPAAQLAALDQQAVVLPHPALRAHRILGIERRIAIQQRRDRGQELLLLDRAASDVEIDFH